MITLNAFENQAIHQAESLAMTAIGTSQEGSGMGVIEQFALMSKMAGADIQHIGDAGLSGMALPENIMAWSIALRGRRHTYRRKLIARLGAKRAEDKDENLMILNRMREVIRENIEIDADMYIDGFVELYKNLKAHEITLDEDMLVGLVLHLACAIKKIEMGDFLKANKNDAQNDFLMEEYKKYRNILKNAFSHHISVGSKYRW